MRYTAFAYKQYDRATQVSVNRASTATLWKASTDRKAIVIIECVRISERKMYKLCSFSVIFLYALFSATIFDTVEMQIDSPCPNIFEYSMDENQRLFGKIKLDIPPGSNIVLNVELSVGNSVQDYNGNIELTYGRAKAVDEIMSGRPLYYNVFFPLWRVFPPRVTKILVNGELICSGPPLDIKRVPVLTTINLQHSLKISSISLGSSPNKIENPPPVQPTPQKNPGNLYFQFGAPDQQYPNNPFLNIPNGNNKPLENPFLTYFNGNKPDSSKPAPDKTEGSSMFDIMTNRYKGEPTSTPRPVVTTTAPRPVVTEEPPKIDIRVNLNDVCGKSLSTNSLIANGQPVISGYYPWLVALYNIRQLNLEFTCGGSLISNRHVVTAAHCMRQNGQKFNIEQLLVIIGKFNIQRWTNDNSVMLSAKKVSVHPDYTVLSADADIAVITLTQEVKFKRFIRPICLWSEPNDLNNVVGEKGVVAGWGKDENGATLSPEPKQVTLPIVTQVQCLESHDDFADITSDRTFCAGFRNGSGPCNGDSGGGFMMLRDGRWTLRGVVSMSIADQGRCDLSQYLVFTDVSKFSDWILETIKQ
ncbi:Serine protease gd N-terminus [Popillia japonica]|uniref:Serine protease gd N-terminus n=1 Tax=Popillia japonica TaxID=7064 RepID=A0AAW1N3Q0_POPJA